MIDKQDTNQFPKEYAELFENNSDVATEFIKNAFIASPFGIFILSIDGRLLNANSTLVTMLGFENRSELIKSTNQESSVAQSFQSLADQLTKTPDAKYFEQIVNCNDGRVLYVNLFIQHIKLSTGSEFYLCFTENITTYKENVETQRRRGQILESISLAAEEFLQTPDPGISLQKTLRILGEVTGADRVYVFQNHWNNEDNLTMQPYAEWLDKKIPSIINNPRFFGASYRNEPFVQWMETLCQNEIVTAPTPNSYEYERRFLEQEGIKSIVLVPVSVELDWWGFIGFDTIKASTTWSKEEIEAIKLASSILGAAVQRQRIEQALHETNERFRTMLDFNHDWEYWLSPNGKFVYSTPSFSDITGYNIDLLPQDIDIFRKIIHPDDFLTMQRHLQTIAAFPKEGEIEYRIITKDKQIRHIKHVCKPIFNDKGKYLGQRASNLDITHQKIAERELQQANDNLNLQIERLEKSKRLISTLNEMGKMLHICNDIDEVYSVLAEYCERLFPEQNGALYTYDEDFKELSLAVTFGDTMPNSKETFRPSDCWAIRDNSPYHVPNPNKKISCRHIITNDSAEETPAYVCFPLGTQNKPIGLLHISNISEDDDDERLQLAITVAERTALTITNLNLRNELHRQSIIDPLTGLYNRRFMNDMIVREIQLSERQNKSFTVVMIDIDDFKIYNDIYGHDTGDQIIRTVGNFLKSNIRSVDFACRYGGDEFTLILPNTNPTQAKRRVDELRRTVKKLDLRHEGESMRRVTISIGVASYPDHGTTEKDLLRVADTALYEAKDKGKDKTIIAQEEVYESSSD